MDALFALYQKHSASSTQMAAHMPILYTLARQCDTAVEFGVGRGSSSVAIIMGVEHRLDSYEIEWRPRCAAGIEAIAQAAGKKWVRHTLDSRLAKFGETDMLLIDSLHSYEHCSAELAAHADQVRKFLVFHDTISHGTVGQEKCIDEDPTRIFRWEANPKVLGIRPAIDELMIRDRSWRIMLSHHNSSGLLVLERK